MTARWSERAEDLGEEFARETGELTAHRWRIGLSLYLVFAIMGAVAEWRYYPERGTLLLLAQAAQAAVIATAWVAMPRRVVHPRTAWIVLLSNVGICLILGLYNGAVGGDMLYVLITYLSFMLVSCMFIPWGAGFQMGLNGGVLGSYALALACGARVGPVPPYDYIDIVADALLSTLGALYIDQYRRRLFMQTTALRAANRNLEAANQARTQLLSGLAHDMRTPIAILMGYAEMLDDDAALPDGLRQPLRSINRESRELLHLIDGVLDLARLEAGRLPFQRSTFRLSEVLDPLRETMEDLLRDRGIGLRWEVPITIVLDSDAGKIREIIRNLLSNAAKYTQEGEIRLSCTAADGGFAIAVTDTGVGIPPEQRQAIFDPFHQVSGQHGHGVAGSGFGLYLVKLLVTLVGGRIDVQSAPGGGSTFQLWLPPEPPTL